MPSLLERLQLDSQAAPAVGERTGSGASFEHIYNLVQTSILEKHVDLLKSARQGGHHRRVLERFIERLLVEHGFEHRGFSRRALIQELASRMLGYGPLDRWLQDDRVSEIMVNGPKQVYVEVDGRIVKSEAVFEGTEQLVEVIRRMVGITGRRIDASSPYVDARLPDGCRINAVLPPLAVDGPLLTIRRFPSRPLTVAALIKFGTLTIEVFEFLRSCVRARLNCLVSGGTATGKTTLLNILAGCIEVPEERVITMEDAVELRLEHEHRVALETRPPNIEGKGEITLRDLLRNALRMRPDRLVVGEVRGAEAYDLLQALNTGHDGSLATVHANSAREALDRLESMALTAGPHVTASLIRRQINAAIQVIVHLKRYPDGKRVVQEVVLVNNSHGNGVLVPVYRHMPSSGASAAFNIELPQLPAWATPLWTEHGLPVPHPSALVEQVDGPVQQEGRSLDPGMYPSRQHEVADV